MKTIYTKLKLAREEIRNSDLKKSGRNDYSKYDYYTPEQVENLVASACEKTNTIVVCNLKADEFGLFQTLTFVDLDNAEELFFEMRTKHGEITATNETQQMGGTDTYSERYIKMKVFQIKDNNLDLDSQDNSGKSSKPTTKTGNSDPKKQCPFCKEWHTGAYKVCTKCFAKEKSGEKLTKTKTIINEQAEPFK